MKINILYIVSTLKRSGPINQLSYIIKYLDRSKFNPLVLALSKEKANSMKPYFEKELGVKVHSLELSRLQGMLKGKVKIKKFIADNEINIVHTQGIRADSFVSTLKIPRVATLRNYPYYDYPMTYGKLKGFIMAKWHLAVLKKIDCPVVVSESVSMMLKERNRYSIGFVRNGVNLE